MKSSRKRGGKTHFDRISSLPDELVGHILSYLPTRFAVSTSILSTRWRYLFTLTDCLSFDDAPCFAFTRGIDTDKKQRFKEFVYRVLQLHQISPINKFSLVCQHTCEISDLNAWVSNAVQKGVQELHYAVHALHSELPDGVVVCETLVRLELMGSRYYQMKIPLSASLPCLKILHLDNVTFFDQFSMQRLFSSSRMLEELTVYSCGSYTSGHGIISTRQLKVLRIEHCNFKDGFFEIDAPNLAYLIYNHNVGVKIVPSWKHSCSLIKAELNFSWSTYSLDSYSVKSDREILKTAAYKTTELSLISDSVEGKRGCERAHYLSIHIIKLVFMLHILLKLAYQEQMPMFHSLSKLHLYYVYSNSWKYVTSLLDKSPQLETIIFEEGLLHCSHYLALPPSEPFSCHAQVIEVRKFCGSNGSLLRLGHLLRNTRFLKKLIVRPCHCYNDAQKEVKINKSLIMKLPRASNNCCIELIK